LIYRDGCELGFFVPRSNVESILTATEEHNLKMFGDAAGQWQKQMGEMEQGDKRRESSNGIAAESKEPSSK